MWRRCLLSLSLTLFVLLPLQSRAQSPFCDDAARVDSTINWISRTYDYTSRDWQNACDSLLNLCPDLDQVWQMKAMPAVKTGDWYNCFSNLMHAVQLRPDRWLPYQAMLKFFFTKDYAGALTDFRRCETLLPGGATQDHSYYFFMGICCLELNDLKQATNYLSLDVGNQEKYRGAENVHYVSLMYWGICQLQNGNYAFAEDVLRRSLKFYPQYPEANYYLGICLKRQKRNKEASDFFRKAWESLKAGYHSNEDQEFYVNYPFSISTKEVLDQLRQ